MANSTIATRQLREGAEFVKRDGSVVYTGNHNTGGFTVTGLAAPVNPLDAVTKVYVDGLISGLDIKQSCRASTTDNITLSGTQTVDGVALSAGDRVLVKSQTNATENGIWVVSAGAWTRAGDADNSPGLEVSPNMFTFIEEGTINGDTGWTLVTSGVITLGTTSLSFVQFSGAGSYSEGNGLTLTGNQFSVTTISSSRITVSSSGIDLATVGNSATGSLFKIAVDAYGRVTGYVAVLAADIPSIDINTQTTGTLGVTRGGTGLTTYTVGDIIYATSTNTLGKLADVATGNVIISGGVGALPTYGKVGLTTHISGILGATNGGTGIDTSAAGNGKILIGNGAGMSLNNITPGSGITITNGAGSITLTIDTTIAMVKSNFVVRENLTFTSGNASVALASAPVLGSERIYLNGLLLNQGAGNDYTITAGGAITLLGNAIPVTGDIILANYLK